MKKSEIEAALKACDVFINDEQIVGVRDYEVALRELLRCRKALEKIAEDNPPPAAVFIARAALADAEGGGE